MTFDELDIHVITMGDFQLKWRFTEEKYDILPQTHLNELKPLNKKGSLYLSNYLSTCNVHSQVPFKSGLFRNKDMTAILDDNEKEVTKWLYHRAIPFNKKVYLSWDDENGMITKWKFVVKYWDSIFYSGSDDLTVFDKSLEWALLFFHENEIYFGTNNDYESKREFDENWFDVQGG